MKILITGANGYIGQHVTKTLLDAGHEVVASDIAIDNIDPRAQIVQGNIFEMEGNNYQSFGCPDVCIHFSWRDGFMHNSLAHLTDLPMHIRFLKGLVRDGLPQLAVMGTMHEVGYHEGSVDEYTSCHPQSRYAMAKNALRVALALYCQDKCVFQWLRGYYIMGDDSKNNSIFTKLLAAANAGKKTFPFNTGKNKYDFIDINELSHQIAAVVSQKEISGIINVGSGKAVALSEMVERYISDNHLRIKLQYGAFPDRPYDSPEIFGDPTKLNEILRRKHG